MKNCIRSCIPLLLVLPVFWLASCSGSKEGIQTVKPETQKTPTPVPEVDTRIYDYEDRYFVKDASIDRDTNVDDPLQAIRVIQLKSGPNQVLVLSKIEKVNGIGVETWFGVEQPSFAPGVYDIAQAANVRFYRFFLGPNSKRFDGKAFRGAITIERAQDGMLIGTMDIMINGMTKSFTEPSANFSSTLSGSFRIKEVPIEATVVKGKQ